MISTILLFLLPLFSPLHPGMCIIYGLMWCNWNWFPVASENVFLWTYNLLYYDLTMSEDGRFEIESSFIKNTERGGRAADSVAPEPHLGSFATGSLLGRLARLARARSSSLAGSRQGKADLANFSGARRCSHPSVSLTVGTSIRPLLAPLVILAKILLFLAPVVKPTKCTNSD